MQPNNKEQLVYASTVLRSATTFNGFGPKIKKLILDLQAKLDKQEPTKHYINYFFQYISSGMPLVLQFLAIHQTLNHTPEVQLQVLTLITKYLLYDQPYSMPFLSIFQASESPLLINVLLQYLQFILIHPLPTLTSHIANLCALVFLAHPIIDLRYPLFSQIDIHIANPYANPHPKVALFSDLTFQQVLRKHVFQAQSLHKHILNRPEPEFKAILLQSPIPTQPNPIQPEDLNAPLILQNIDHLPTREQILYYLSRKKLENQDLINLQILLKQPNIPHDFDSGYLSNFLLALMQSSNLSFDQAFAVLNLLAIKGTFALVYEEIRPLLLAASPTHKSLIIQILKTYADQTDQIFALEIDQPDPLPLNLLALLIQLLNKSHFPLLYQKLIQRKISRTQCFLLHLLILTENIDVDLRQLLEQCLNFNQSLDYLIQLFSYYSITFKGNQKRNIKLLNSFQQLASQQEGLTFEDLLIVLGTKSDSEAPSNPPPQLDKLLNQHWDTISNYLKSLVYQPQIVYGFYQIMHTFMKQSDSEFLRLYSVITEAFKAGNKQLNYFRLCQALKEFDFSSLQSKMRLYLLLLKVNYTLNEKYRQVRASFVDEERSGISSEFYQCETAEETENTYKEIVEVGKPQLQRMRKQIDQLERSQIERHVQCPQSYLMIYKLLRITHQETVKLLPQFEKAEVKQILEGKLQDSGEIWNALKSLKSESLASPIIQIFKNASQLTILRMIYAELAKFIGENYREFCNYDLAYLELNEQREVDSVELLKLSIKSYQAMLTLDDNFRVLKAAYTQVEKSKFQTLALLIAIGLYCGMSQNLINSLGERSETCINKLLVSLSRAGQLRIVLLLLRKQNKPKIKGKKKKAKQKIEVEMTLADYLSSDDKIQQFQTQILQLIQRNITKNNDLNQEFLKLAQQVLQLSSTEDYELILPLFDQVPPELTLICLESCIPSNSAEELDAKFEFILLLLSKLTPEMWEVMDPKRPLTPEGYRFFELSFQILSECQKATVSAIKFSFQLVNMMKVRDNENETPAEHNSIDMVSLAEILIPEPYNPTECQQQQGIQHIFQCTNCPNQGRNVNCCASCFVTCHQQHQIEYAGQFDQACECTRRCQMRSRLLQQHFQPLNHEFRDMPLPKDLLMTSLYSEQFVKHRHYEINGRDKSEKSFPSDDEQQSSGSSPKLPAIEEPELLEIVDSDLHLSMEQENPVECLQEASQTLQSATCQQISLNYQPLLAKFVQNCHFAIQSYSPERNAFMEQGTKEFKMPPAIKSAKKVLHLLEERVHLKQEKVEFSSRFQDIMSQSHSRSDSAYLFYIRKLLDSSEGIIVAAHQHDLRIYSKSRVIKASSTGKCDESLLINSKPLKRIINSIAFNPHTPRQLLVSSVPNANHHDVSVIEISPEGQILNERSIIQRKHSTLSMVTKILWVSQYQVAYLQVSQIVVKNISTDREQVYKHKENKRFKDFCISQKVLYAFDFSSSDIFFCNLSENDSTVMNQHFTLPPEYKIESSFSFCIQTIPDTNILLISFKQGHVLLCQINNNEIQRVIQLENVLQAEGITETLLSNMNVLDKSEDHILLAALGLSHKVQSQQFCFHQGKLIILELSSSGDLKIQQALQLPFPDAQNNDTIDSYTILNEGGCTYIMMVSNTRGFIVQKVPVNQSCYPQIAGENKELICNQLKEVFNHQILQESVKHFKPLQNFCLPPSELASQQQIQVGPTSIIVNQDYCITGLVFVKPQSESVKIFGSRVIQKRANQPNLIVPLNIVEQIYTYLHHSLEMTPIKCQNIQVYIKKMSLSSALAHKLVQILNNQNMKNKNYMYENFWERQVSLRNVLSDQQIILLASLDSLGIFIQARQNNFIDFSLVPKLIELVENNTVYISQSAKKLLRIILSNPSNKAILGDQFHFKSIMDQIFLNKIKRNTAGSTKHVIQKLNRIGLKRLPQLYYCFHQHPSLVQDLISEAVDFKILVTLLIHYMNFLMNSQRDCSEFIGNLERKKQYWALTYRIRFNKFLKEKLVLTVKGKNSVQVYEYKWRLFDSQASPIHISNQMIEEKPSDDSIDDFGQSEVQFENLEYEFMEKTPMRTPLRMMSHLIQPLQSRSSSLMQTTQISICQFDLCEAMIRYLIPKLRLSNNVIRNRNEDQVTLYLMQIYQLFGLLEGYCQFSSSGQAVFEMFGEVIDPNQDINLATILITLMNSKQLTDAFWGAWAQWQEKVLPQQQIFEWLQAVSKKISESEKSKKQLLRHFEDKQLKLHGLAKKLQDLLQNFNVTGNSNCRITLVRLLEKVDVIYFVQMLRFLSNVIQISAEAKRQFQQNKDTWLRFLCTQKLNQDIKEVAREPLKALIHELISREQYHSVKDFILYQIKFETLSVAAKSYVQTQQQYNALNLMVKSAKRRGEGWREFCANAPQRVQVLKQHMKRFPNQIVELFEILVLGQQGS